YKGTSTFASLIGSSPEVIYGLDKYVRRQQPEFIKGIVTPRQRREGEARIAILSEEAKSPDIQTAQKAKNDMAVVKLGIAQKQKIRDAFVGQVDVEQIPVIVKEILLIREKNPEAFNSYEALSSVKMSSEASSAAFHLASLMNLDTVDSINEVIKDGNGYEKIGVVDLKSKYAQDLIMEITLTKAAALGEEELMKVFMGDYNGEELEKLEPLIVNLARADRDLFTLDKFTMFPTEVQNMLRNENVQSKFDQLVVTSFEKSPRESKLHITSAKEGRGREIIPENVEINDIESALAHHKFGSLTGLVSGFQHRMDQFPTVNGVWQGPEIGAQLIGDNEHSINTALFAETMIAVEGLEKHTSRQFPQAFVGTDGKNLVWKFTVDRTKNGALVTESVVLPFTAVRLNADIGKFFPKRLQAAYSQLSTKKLVQTINEHPYAVNSVGLVDNELKNYKFLPYSLGQNSTIGSSNQYFEMPVNIAYANFINQYFSRGVFQKINAHLHLRKYDFNLAEQDLIKSLPEGELTLWTLASRFDIALILADQSANRGYDALLLKLLKLNYTNKAYADFYQKLSTLNKGRNIEQKKTQTSGIIIIGADAGIAQRASVFDLNDFDKNELMELEKASDRALTTTDIGPIKALAGIVAAKTKTKLSAHMGDPKLKAEEGDRAILSSSTENAGIRLNNQTPAHSSTTSLTGSMPNGSGNILMPSPIIDSSVLPSIINFSAPFLTMPLSLNNSTAGTMSAASKKGMAMNSSNQTSSSNNNVARPAITTTIESIAYNTYTTNNSSENYNDSSMKNVNNAQEPKWTAESKRAMPKRRLRTKKNTSKAVSAVLTKLKKYKTKSDIFAQDHVNQDQIDNYFNVSDVKALTNVIAENKAKNQDVHVGMVAFTSDIKGAYHQNIGTILEPAAISIMDQTVKQYEGRIARGNNGEIMFVVPSNKNIDQIRAEIKDNVDNFISLQYGFGKVSFEDKDGKEVANLTKEQKAKVFSVMTTSGDSILNNIYEDNDGTFVVFERFEQNGKANSLKTDLEDHVTSINKILKEQIGLTVVARDAKRLTGPQIDIATETVSNKMPAQNIYREARTRLAGKMNVNVNPTIEDMSKSAAPLALGERKLLSKIAKTDLSIKPNKIHRSGFIKKDVIVNAINSLQSVAQPGNAVINWVVVNMKLMNGGKLKAKDLSAITSAAVNSGFVASLDSDDVYLTGKNNTDTAAKWIETIEQKVNEKRSKKDKIAFSGSVVSMNDVEDADTAFKTAKNLTATDTSHIKNMNTLTFGKTVVKVYEKKVAEDVRIAFANDRVQERQLAQNDMDTYETEQAGPTVIATIKPSTASKTVVVNKTANMFSVDIERNLGKSITLKEIKYENSGNVVAYKFDVSKMTSKQKAAAGFEDTLSGTIELSKVEVDRLVAELSDEKFEGIQTQLVNYINDSEVLKDRASLSQSEMSTLVSNFINSSNLNTIEAVQVGLRDPAAFVTTAKNEQGDLVAVKVESSAKTSTFLEQAQLTAQTTITKQIPVVSESVSTTADRGNRVEIAQFETPKVEMNTKTSQQNNGPNGVLPVVSSLYNRESSATITQKIPVTSSTSTTIIPISTIDLPSIDKAVLPTLQNTIIPMPVNMSVPLISPLSLGNNETPTVLVPKATVKDFEKLTERTQTAGLTNIADHDPIAQYTNIVKASDSRAVASLIIVKNDADFAVMAQETLNQNRPLIEIKKDGKIVEVKADKTEVEVKAAQISNKAVILSKFANPNLNDQQFKDLNKVIGLSTDTNELNTDLVLSSLNNKGLLGKPNLANYAIAALQKDNTANNSTTATEKPIDAAVLGQDSKHEVLKTAAKTAAIIGTAVLFSPHNSRHSLDQQIVPVYQNFNISNQADLSNRIYKAISSNSSHGKISLPQVINALEFSTTKENLVGNTYKYLTDNKIFAAEDLSFPVIFLENETNDMALALGSVGVIVVNRNEIEALGNEEEQKKLLSIKIAHERTHLINGIKHPEMAVLEDETKAYENTYKALASIKGEDDVDVMAQKTVWQAFEVMTQNPGMVTKIFGLKENDFGELNYSNIALNDNSVDVEIYSMKTQKTQTVRINPVTKNIEKVDQQKTTSTTASATEKPTDVAMIGQKSEAHKIDRANLTGSIKDSANLTGGLENSGKSNDEIKLERISDEIDHLLQQGEISSGKIMLTIRTKLQAPVGLTTAVLINYIQAKIDKKTTLSLTDTVKEKTSIFKKSQPIVLADGPQQGKNNPPSVGQGASHVFSSMLDMFGGDYDLLEKGMYKDFNKSNPKIDEAREKANKLVGNETHVILDIAQKALNENDRYYALALMEMVDQKPDLSLNDLNRFITLLPKISLFETREAVEINQRAFDRQRDTLINKVLYETPLTEDQYSRIAQIYNDHFIDSAETRKVEVFRTVPGIRQAVVEKIESDFQATSNYLHYTNILLNQEITHADISSGKNLSEIVTNQEATAEKKLSIAREYFSAKYGIALEIPYDEGAQAENRDSTNQTTTYYSRKEADQILERLYTLDKVVSVLPRRLVLNSISLQKFRIVKEDRAKFNHFHSIADNRIVVDLNSVGMIQTLFHEWGHSLHGERGQFAAPIIKNRIQQVVEKNRDIFMEGFNDAAWNEDSGKVVWDTFKTLYNKRLSEWKDFNKEQGIEDLNSVTSYEESIDKKVFKEKFGFDEYPLPDAKNKPSLALSYIFVQPIFDTDKTDRVRDYPTELIAEYAQLYILHPEVLQKFDPVGYDLMNAVIGHA
ncbi:MAG: hypothetical protein KBD53_11230, partial [Candidatus Omnitrophica bacterium]|nr:hypothetical protein [Candidatus Omnitrophota bacterium]